MSGEKHNSLYEYCNHMSMSYSYKPVLILSLFANNGKECLDDAANFFLGFYGQRLELGLVAEKANSIYSNLKCSFALVKQNIRQNPIKALVNSSNFFLIAARAKHSRSFQSIGRDFKRLIKQTLSRSAMRDWKNTSQQ